MSHLIQGPVAHLFDSYFIVTTYVALHNNGNNPETDFVYCSAHCPDSPAKALTSLFLGSTRLFDISFSLLLLLRV